MATTPTLAEDLNASNEAYTQPGVSTPFATDYPEGLTPLQTKVGGQLQDVYSYDAQDGFYAVAFETPANQVLIAYEGTNLFTGNDQFTAAQIADDADIVSGSLSPAFTDARQFAASVRVDARADHIRPRNVFLTGHSLGAAEAEYVGAQTGMSGTTFGTPGISSRFFRRPVSHLTNYVEIGDPVGNYAIENTGNPLLPAPINDIVGSLSPTNAHYGTTHFIGQTDPVSLGAYASLRVADSLYKGGGAANVALATAALGAAVPDHYLAQYGADLGVPLASRDASTGATVTPLSAASAAGVTAQAATPSAHAAAVAGRHAEAAAPRARAATVAGRRTEADAAAPLCFAQGTRLATPRGEVAVEALAVGDRVVTACGAQRTIRWLGSRTLASAEGPLAWGSRPVRILAGAFGAGLPRRDLLLSPGHPVLVGAEAGEGGVLVPVMCLVNGTTIDRVAVERVTYWHVELDAHDILLAEGLAAESYIECGDRAFFDGADDPLADPDMVTPGLGARCRPVAIDGDMVTAERRRLDAVFTTRLAAACAWPEAEQPRA